MAQIRKDGERGLVGDTKKRSRLDFERASRIGFGLTGHSYSTPKTPLLRNCIAAMRSFSPLTLLSFKHKRRSTQQPTFGGCFLERARALQRRSQKSNSDQPLSVQGNSYMKTEQPKIRRFFFFLRFDYSHKPALLKNAGYNFSFPFS